MLVLGVDSVSACEVEFGVWYLESVFRTIANYVEVGCVFVVIRLNEFKDRLALQKDCCLSILKFIEWKTLMSILETVQETSSERL